MSTYQGFIVSIPHRILSSNRIIIKKGYEIRNFNATVFTRIPRERILNKFKSQGGNINY